LPQQIPGGNPITGAKVYLGKTLFWEEQLSSTKTVACGTCHRGRAGGSDPRPVSDPTGSTNPGYDGIFGTDDDVVGSRGVPLNRADGTYAWSPQFGLHDQVTPRKSLSAFNGVFANVGLFWDTRAGGVLYDPVSGTVALSDQAFLETQALAPILNTTEMGNLGRTWNDVIARLTASRPLALSPAIPPALSRWIADRPYPDLFSEAFGTPDITPVRIAMAIASYERTLITDRAPIDAVIAGSRTFQPAEQRGLTTFLANSCNSCHNAPLMTNETFENIGLRPDFEDYGREIVSGLPEDAGRFRGPSLRNVAFRAPFMHNGRSVTLESVMDFYNRGGDFKNPSLSSFVHPLGLTAEQEQDVLAFMRDTLTDPRAVNETGPLFERPTLYTESARVPVFDGGGGTPGPDGKIPEAIAIEPPFVGNPSFTVGLQEATPGAQAVLVIDMRDPGAGPAIPAGGSFAHTTVKVSDDGAGHGYASVNLSIPSNPSLAGTTLFGRWFVTINGAVSVTAAFQFTIFAAQPSAGNPFLSVSAASLTHGLVAPNSLVTGFGSGLPTTGTAISITDSTGSEFSAPLLFSSATQLNYLMPAGVAPGEATVTVSANGAVIASGTAEIGSVAPALFTADSSGIGTASALVQQVTANGVQTTGASAAPIDLSSEAFLLLFGTGIRGHSPSGVTATIAGLPVDVLYAGAQGQYQGLDQVNLRLSPDFPRRGDVDVVLNVGGKLSNVVRVNLQYRNPVQ
jgi:cytochrome c peroxidase